MRLKGRAAVLAGALVFVLLAALPVRAQTQTNFQAEFQTGQDALDRGDFRTAYRVFRSLAEEGFAKSQ